MAMVIGVAAMPGLAHAQTCHHGVVDGDTIEWETRTVSAALLSPPRGLESIEGGSLEDGELRSPSTMRLRTRQSFDGVLRPPLVRGAQRITLASPSGQPMAFEPDVDGALERHIGYATTPGLEREARRRLDEVCGEVEGVPLYVDAARPVELRGALASPSARRQTLLWVGGLLLLALSVGGGIAYRRMRDRAAAERAEALLEERYRALE